MLSRLPLLTAFAVSVFGRGKKDVSSKRIMIRTMLTAMLAVVTAVLAGCVTAGRQASSCAELLPIAFNEKSTQKLDYEVLGEPGQRVTVYGMLCNSRKWKESKQEQWLLASLPEAPLCQYAFRLAKPVLQLPPCDVQSADPPGKGLVGPYKMTGTLGIGWTDPKLTYSRDKYHQLAEVKFEKLGIPRSIPANCATAVRHQWRQIGRFTIGSGFPSTLDARESSQLPLSDFIRQHDPILLGLSVDGKRALYCCAGGRKYLSWHGEAHARVYCLVDLERKNPIKLYITASSGGLE